MHVLYGEVGRVEMKGNRSVTGVSGVCYMFLESGVEGSRGLAYVSYVEGGALNGIVKVVALTMEILFNMKCALGSLDG